MKVKKYRAKQSYMKLPLEESYWALGDPKKHETLLAGKWINAEPPADIEKHLTTKKKVEAK